MLFSLDSRDRPLFIIRGERGGGEVGGFWMCRSKIFQISPPPPTSLCSILMIPSLGVNFLYTLLAMTDPFSVFPENYLIPHPEKNENIL